MITNVGGSKSRLTDEYWVEKISDHKIRYKYYPKRGTIDYYYGGCELSMTYYDEIDKEAYKAFVDAIRKYTQQPIIIKINEWVYVTLNDTKYESDDLNDQI